MGEEEKLGLFQDEIQVGVSVTSFMTGVTIFFTGLLITKFEDYDLSIRIPILFLIISTFGFLYSTLIYSNASGFISRGIAKKFRKNMNFGDAVGEYLGVYFLVLSIPLVINAITADLFLRVATLAASLGGLIVYHISGFSIMERHYKRFHYLFLFSIICLESLLFLMQKTNCFVYLSVLLISFLIILTFLSIKKFNDNS